MASALAFAENRVVRAAESADLAPGARSRIRRGTALFLGGWLALALALARSSPTVDVAGNGVVPVSFLLFAGVSIGVAIGLIAFSPWRKVVDAIPSDALISVQVYRLIGGILLPLYAIGSLPGHFALPAGWGDLAVGLLAPFVPSPCAVNRAERDRWRWDGMYSAFWTFLPLWDWAPGT